MTCSHWPCHTGQCEQVIYELLQCALRSVWTSHLWTVAVCMRSVWTSHLWTAVVCPEVTEQVIMNIAVCMRSVWTSHLWTAAVCLDSVWTSHLWTAAVCLEDSVNKSSMNCCSVPWGQCEQVIYELLCVTLRSVWTSHLWTAAVCPEVSVNKFYELLPCVWGQCEQVIYELVAVCLMRSVWTSHLWTVAHWPHEVSVNKSSMNWSHMQCATSEQFIDDLNKSSMNCCSVPWDQCEQVIYEQFIDECSHWPQCEQVIYELFTVCLEISVNKSSMNLFTVWPLWHCVQGQCEQVTMTADLCEQVIWIVASVWASHLWTAVCLEISVNNQMNLFTLTSYTVQQFIDDLFTLISRHTAAVHSVTCSHWPHTHSNNSVCMRSLCSSHYELSVCLEISVNKSSMNCSVCMTWSLCAHCSHHMMTCVTLWLLLCVWGQCEQVIYELLLCVWDQCEQVIYEVHEQVIYELVHTDLRSVCNSS